MRLLIILATMIAIPLATQAQERTPSHCIALAQSIPGAAYVIPANLPEVAREEVHLHYIAHAAFLIRSHQGLNMVTDYAGFTGTLPFIPDVVTMNHAHATHWTANPDPAIPHVLRGWGETHGAGIEHNLDLGEVLVRNVSTDIRSAFSGIEEKGNSIFVFEMAGLCIGHLGHLHHAPDEGQYAQIGRLDVVMAPVDGGYTLDQPTMISVLKRFKSSIVIPMHWFSSFALEDFLDGMEDEFQIVRVEGPSLTVSLDRLPGRPTIMVLDPSYLNVDR
ncbi:MAG: MBL fold metallo-hydrolase [Sulfitobacter sp.]|nr:MBL fold metallo-hydrolase [Sulfitobacter sp.]